jgi:uncharacterized protein
MFNFLKNGTGKILQLFFQNPEKEYYFREIGKYLEQEPGSLQRYLDNLVNEGILIDEYRANLRYFRLNQKHFLYEELKSMVSKTIGMEAKLKKLIEGTKGVEYAFIFGSIPKNQECGQSDIDVMLIGRADQDQLINKISLLEDELGREINYHVYSKEETIRKINENNDFLVRIFNEPKIILKGNLNAFTKIN